MQNVIAGATGCSNSQAPTIYVGTHRRNILDVVIGCDLCTTEEQLWCIHFVATGWDLDEQDSRLSTATLLLGFADMAEACQQLPPAGATLTALGDPSEVSYSQAC